MRAIHLAFVLLVTVAPGAALARGWQGVIPGASTDSEIATKFGPPSTQGKLSGRVALVYKGDQAIPGTRQAQFFARDDGVVVEVVVFPTNQLDRETVEGTYGRPSHKAFTDDFRTVWFFKPAGITVYFAKDGFVDAISFKAPEGAARADPPHRAAAKPPAGRAEAAPSPQQ
ncbi:MAG TPA: hypothetical protein VF904_13960 [Anaeromyxobacteraceae bacterium]